MSNRVSRPKTSPFKGFPNVCFICEQPFLSKDKPKAYFCPNHGYLGFDQRAVNALIRQLNRARKAGLPATLTWREWKKTLDDFHHWCAYCRNNPYYVLEHFIPLGQQGSGTTVDNCVPACAGCNRRKGGKAPEASQLTPDQRERVRTYLALRGSRQQESLY
jgi:5-methylcytosine-specific restriction endonuclease McrA